MEFLVEHFFARRKLRSTENSHVSVLSFCASHVEGLVHFMKAKLKPRVSSKTQQ